MHYIKWQDTVIAVIDNEDNVHFIYPDYNQTVSLYTRSQTDWTSEQYYQFLSERIVNPDRRDIEKILYRCNLVAYDVFRIADITRAIHPKDMLWIAHDENEKMKDILPPLFESIFGKKADLEGQSVYSPEGYNIKRYGVYEKYYGIYKKRISPLHTDVESEIAVSLLGDRLGVPCCPAYRVDKDTMFSAFLYDFSKEYIVHFRRLLEDQSRTEDEYKNLIAVRPQFKDHITKMVLLDFITRQDDRHLSNIALKITPGGESFYPLYDNGRSLFYEDTQEMTENAVQNVDNNATSFGFIGTYRDIVDDILEDYGYRGIKNLMNLNVSKTEVEELLKSSGFSSYRLDGSLQWIMQTLDILRGR